MRDLVLCIDDDGGRYRYAHPVFSAHGWLPLVTDEPGAVAYYLDAYRDRIVGVCLDHDMRTADGAYFAREHLCALSLPVAIVSANSVGAERIARILCDFGVMYAVTPATDADWPKHAASLFTLD
jgi:hypothetical protein